MTAIVLIAVFLITLAVMMANRADANWDRMVYLLTGLEAVVFAGAAVLFGTTVQRQAVHDAQQDVAEARDETQDARREADEAKSEAMAGRTLKEAVLAKSEATARAALSQPGALGSRPAEPSAGAATGASGSDIEELARLAKALFKDG